MNKDHENQPKNPRRLRTVAVALALAAAASVAIFALTPDARSPGTSGEALIGGAFELVDQAGRAVSEEEFRGQLMLVMFGYSFCPDICPTELQNISRAMDLLGDHAGQVQPLFITIDPTRDTVEILAQYMAHFHPKILGLTGSETQIEVAAKAYRVYYQKAGDDGAGEDYLMDHTAIIYLMDQDGRYLEHFSVITAPEDMARAIAGRIPPAPWRWLFW